MTTILDKLKKEIPKISEETKNIISQIQSSLDEDLVPDFSDGFVGEMEIADENLKSFLKTWDGTGDVTERYNEYLKSASSSTSAFASSLKSVAANMAIMLAIGLAIKTVIALWDKANVTVEEVQSKIDDLTSSISTLKSEYQELSSKENLTSFEQKRLKYLEDRIALEERLLTVEKERLYQEKYGDKFTDYFDKDSYAHKTFFDSNDSLYNETERATDRTQYTVDEYNKTVQNGDKEKQLEYTIKLEQKRLEYEEAYLK